MLSREFSAITDDWLRPFGLLGMSALWWIGLNLLGLPGEVLVVLLVAVKLLAIFSAIWFVFRVLDIVFAYMLKHARNTTTKVDDVLVPLFRKALKVFVFIVGFVFVASNVNLDVSGLLAGLGLGGLAFALAAKDAVQNIFGSITVLLDQSFHVGDWVVIGDIEGSVEEVGLRSTRIRTFYNSIITMPNSRLITASVDNMGRRSFRRYKTKIALTYDTPADKIEAFCEALREIVRLHPYMRKDYYQIYLNDMAANSLDVLVYIFWQTPDWSTELRERHRFLLDTIRVAEQLGVEFAFPTQTVYWKNGEAPAEPAGAEEDVATLCSEARSIARQVVESSTGLDLKPAPVVIK